MVTACRVWVVRSIDGHPVCVKRCRSAAANAWPLLCCVRHKLFSMNISTSAQPMVSLQQPWGSAVACRSSSKLSKPYLWHRLSENVSITGSTRTKKNGRMQWHTKRGYVVRARVGQVHRARHSLGPFTFREHQLPAWAQLHPPAGGRRLEGLLKRLTAYRREIQLIEVRARGGFATIGGAHSHCLEKRRTHSDDAAVT